MLLLMWAQQEHNTKLSFVMLMDIKIFSYSTARPSCTTTTITCMHGSSKHIVMDNSTFLWESAIFRHLPIEKSLNQSTQNFAQFIMLMRSHSMPKMVPKDWMEAASHIYGIHADVTFSCTSLLFLERFYSRTSLNNAVRPEVVPLSQRQFVVWKKFLLQISIPIILTTQGALKGPRAYTLFWFQGCAQPMLNPWDTHNIYCTTPICPKDAPFYVPLLENLRPGLFCGKIDGSGSVNRVLSLALVSIYWSKRNKMK